VRDLIQLTLVVAPLAMVFFLLGAVFERVRIRGWEGTKPGPYTQAGKERDE